MVVRDELLTIPLSFTDGLRQGGLLMVAETISLGILSLPAAVAGMVWFQGLSSSLGLGYCLLIQVMLLGSSNGDILISRVWLMPVRC